MSISSVIQIFTFPLEADAFLDLEPTCFAYEISLQQCSMDCPSTNGK